jgi:replicative DNA helicase
MEFINIELEEKFLRCLFFDKDLFIKSMSKGTIPKEAFADKSLRFLYSNIQSNFHKQGNLPTVDILKAKANRVSKKSKDSEKFKEKIFSAIDRIVREPNESIKKNFDVYKDEILLLHQARSMQEFVMEVADKLDNASLKEAQESISNFKLPVIGDDVDEGEYTESFRERDAEILDKMRNSDKYQLYPTGIKEWDMAMEGGVGAEMVLISGNSNSGKSFALQQVATNGYRLKKNVIIFTIEMQKNETAYRIDQALSKVHSKFFRNPAKHWSKEEHQKWRKKGAFAKKNYGKLFICAFPKGANMLQIETKVYEIMNRIQDKIHAVVIDYMDDLTPMKQYREAKSWNSFGEIAWDMHQLCKSFRNWDGTLGVPTFTAIQQKKSSKEISSDKEKTARRLDERDIGSSPLPFRIADICASIKNVIDDEYSILQLTKGRGFSKTKDVHLFHNFAYGKFHDESLREKFEEEINTEDAKELEEIEEMEIETGEE